MPRRAVARALSTSALADAKLWASALNAAAALVHTSAAVFAQASALLMQSITALQLAALITASVAGLGADDMAPMGPITIESGLAPAAFPVVAGDGAAAAAVMLCAMGPSASTVFFTVSNVLSTIGSAEALGRALELPAEPPRELGLGLLRPRPRPPRGGVLGWGRRAGWAGGRSSRRLRRLRLRPDEAGACGR